MIQDDAWDHLTELEIDPSWKDHWHDEYWEYRRNFALAQEQKFSGPFPVSIEIEASYYCNLRCPFCPRFASEDLRDVGHMADELWKLILEECGRNELPSILMDHEGESLMNPKIFEMIDQAKSANIFDVWIHTNANNLTAERSRRLIDAGLTKINFSIDAVTPQTYDKLRVGGNYERVIRNVRDFLRIKKEKKAHYLRTRVSFVEQKENIQEKQQFIEFWKKEPGLNVIAFQECNDFSPFGTADDELKLTEEQLDEKYGRDEPFHCSAPWQMPVIDVEGNITPCGSPIREHNKEFILGNLLEGDTIQSCWNGQKMVELKELHSAGKWYRNPVCRVCVKTMRQSRRDIREIRADAEKKNPEYSL